MAQVASQAAGTIEAPVRSAQSAIQRVQTAQALHRRNRAQGLAALNALFREGQAPATPLDGRFAGELVALNIAPGMTQFAEWLLAQWLPWKGKTFDADHSRGDNLFTRDSYTLAHILWPFYRGYIDDGAKTFRAFSFHTYVAPGFQDPDRQVFKIDYATPQNPALSVRRVLDEIVQLDDGYYLGKAHLHWVWGTWQMVAFFSLRS